MLHSMKCKFCYFASNSLQKQDDLVKSEIERQIDKSNNNAIGYFHQNIFKYIKNCIVPSHGFDVIYTRSNGEKVYVEMKNKHNTMNSSSSQKTYFINAKPTYIGT